MSSYLFKLSRMISILLVIYNIYKSNLYIEDLKRELMLFSTLILFLIVSYLYESKLKIFSPTYSIYFIVCFIIQNISPYSYIYNSSSYYTLIANKNARVPSDNYEIYYLVFTMVSILFVIYLTYISKNEEILILDLNEKKIINHKEANSILLTTLCVLLPLSFFVGGIFKTIFIAPIVYYIFFYVKFSEVRKLVVYNAGFIFALIIVINQITSRYVFVRYVVPIGFFFLIFNYIYSNKKPNFSKYTLIIITLSIVTTMYGVLSEFVKLKNKKNEEINLSEIFNIIFNGDELLKWIDRQFYRIFDIWTVLGGNIIDYVKASDYFYGLTYIKSLSNLLNFEYISLPKISASMVGANYAQPGLIAEGYANFGIAGALLNVIVILSVSEFLFRRVLRNPTVFNILLVSVPFSSVLLDGGTLNAVLFNITFIIIVFVFQKSSEKNITNTYRIKERTESFEKSS